jgi:hypothetical protein
MDFREIGWDGADWMDTAQDRDQWRALVNTVINLGGSINCWKILGWPSENWLLKKDSTAYGWLIYFSHVL